MEKAFTYMFNDNMWWKKALSYFFLGMAMNLSLRLGIYYLAKSGPVYLPVILFIIAFITGFFGFGYFISCMKSIMVRDDNIVLPFVNLGKNFVQGFKLFIAIILFYFMIIGAYCLIMLIPVLFALVGLKIITIILLILLLLLLIPLSVALIIYIPAMFCIFAKTEKLTSLCRFGIATKLIKNNPGNYFINILIYYLVSGGIGFVGFVIGMFSFNVALIVTGTILSCTLATYFMYVFTYLLAKSVDVNLLEEK